MSEFRPFHDTFPSAWCYRQGLLVSLESFVRKSQKSVADDPSCCLQVAEQGFDEENSAVAFTKPCEKLLAGNSVKLRPKNMCFQ